MSQTLEERIASLQRKRDLKRVYETLKLSFPKNTNIDIKEEVEKNVKLFLNKMAEMCEIEQSNRVPVPTLAQNGTVIENSQHPSAQEPTKDLKEPIKARLMTLENVDSKVRSRIGSMEIVFVTSQKGDKSRITVSNGMSINVPTEDLDFNVTQ